jgi:glycosyltransferase involved in cell wall biosynthesis
MNSLTAPPRVVHVITGLNTGGAEMMLYKLLRALPSARIESSVVSMLPGGELVEPIADIGIDVHSLNMRSSIRDPGAAMRLIRLLRQLEADLVQTWMYHANLLGALINPWLGNTPLLWNLRQSNLDPKTSKLGTRLVMRAGAGLSWVAPRCIVCCSERTRDVHRALGYRADIMTMIPNGFELDRFRPDADARSALRGELDIDDSAPLLGLVARFHPQKDLRTFFRAAARVRTERPDCRILVCGQDLNFDNPSIARWVEESGLGDAVHLLGPRRDAPRVMAALDLLVSSSAFGEGFPNVIGEAMACGVPCAVTDVGDSGLIVGDTGLTVPPRDPSALAAAILSLLGEGRDGLARRGQAARARIGAEFALARIAARYADLYDSVRTSRPARRSAA